MPGGVGLGVRTTVSAGLLFVLGLFLIWIGFSGRLGLVLGALLCPAQLVEQSPYADTIEPSIPKDWAHHIKDVGVH